MFYNFFAKRQKPKGDTEVGQVYARKLYGRLFDRMSSKEQA